MLVCAMSACNLKKERECVGRGLLKFLNSCPYVGSEHAKIQSVVVTPGYVGTSPNANPSLEVTWSAVDGPAVSYVVSYSQSMGTVTAPPDGASEMSANGNSVTLSINLAPDKRSPYTYYIWVAATSEGVPVGEYSNRTSGVTLHSELSVLNVRQ